MYRVPAKELERTAARLAQEYQTAAPFPHICIDGFFPEEVLNGLLEEFPDPGSIDWVKFHRETEVKLATKREDQIPTRILQFLLQLNSSTFLSFLETLTGIQGLIPDPHFWGGGLHQIVRGGFLKIHADFNWYEKLKVHRRLNLLLFLNRNWKEEYGGHFELWDTSMKECRKKLLPVFNRTVVFSTTDFSYHGHPDPLNCPEGASRKSLALYYYTVERPPEEQTASHSTLFHARPGEAIKKGLKGHLRSLVPPVLFDLYDRLRR